MKNQIPVNPQKLKAVGSYKNNVQNISPKLEV